MNKQLFAVLFALGIFLLVPATKVQAQAFCEVTVSGELRDALNNVVWDTPDYSNSTQATSGECITWAESFVNLYAFALCYGRSSGVHVDYEGAVYHNYSFVDTLPAPDSCRDDFNLNQYTVLQGDEALYADDEIYSPNSAFHLKYQQDGNLVLYDSWSNPIWASDTFSTAGRAIMQADGNLVVYDNMDAPLWDTETDGNSGAFLALRDDGQMVVYGANGAVLWLFSN